MSSCLVLIDLQNGFLSDETLHILPRIQSLLENHHFDHIVGTQFYNHKDSPYVRLMGWTEFMSSPQWDPHPLALSCCQRIFRKDVYTCFTPEFESYLTEHSIDTLYFAGIDTDCCVLKSAADCFERNLALKVLVDCCASNGGAASHQAAILVLERTIGVQNLRYGDFCAT